MERSQDRAIRCGTCWFFREEDDFLGDGHPPEGGYCQRRAPLVSRAEGGVARFPFVYVDWWCGEFKRFDDPNPMTTPTPEARNA